MRVRGGVRGGARSSPHARDSLLQGGRRIRGREDRQPAAFVEAADDKSYRGVIEYTEKPLVSHDIVGNAASCVFSAVDTMASGRVVKVLGWYDNEWGYANRLVDVVELMAS